MIVKKRWCDCKGWQERELIMRLGSPYVSYVQLRKYYVNGHGWIQCLYKRYDTGYVDSETYLDVYEREKEAIEHCPYCATKMQEGFEEINLNRVSDYSDEGVTTHLDVWGSEGPDCVLAPTGA